MGEIVSSPLRGSRDDGVHLGLRHLGAELQFALLQRRDAEGVELVEREQWVSLLSRCYPSSWLRVKRTQTSMTVQGYIVSLRVDA